MLIPQEVIFVMLTIVPMGVIAWLAFLTLRINRKDQADEKKMEADSKKFERIFFAVEKIDKILEEFKATSEANQAHIYKDIELIRSDISKNNEVMRVEMNDLKKNLMNLRKPSNHSRKDTND